MSIPAFSHSHAPKLPPLRLLHRPTAAFFRLASTAGRSLRRSVNFLPVSLPLRFVSSPLCLRFARLRRRPHHHGRLLGRAALLVYSAFQVPQGSSDPDRHPGRRQSPVSPRTAPTPVWHPSRGAIFSRPARARCL